MVGKFVNVLLCFTNFANSYQRFSDGFGMTKRRITVIDF